MDVGPEFVIAQMCLLRADFSHYLWHVVSSRWKRLLQSRYKGLFCWWAVLWWGLLILTWGLRIVCGCVTCDRGHSLARVLWFISFSSSFRAFLTVAWFHCSQGRSSSFAKLQSAENHTQLHLQVNKWRHRRTNSGNIPLTLNLNPLIIQTSCINLNHKPVLPVSSPSLPVFMSF